MGYASIRGPLEVSIIGHRQMFRVVLLYILNFIGRID